MNAIDKTYPIPKSMPRHGGITKSIRGKDGGSYKAWAAIKNTEIVAIRYKDHFNFSISDADTWVQEIEKNYPVHHFDIDFITKENLEEIKQIAKNSGFLVANPDGELMSGYEIAKKAQEILKDLERVSFNAHKQAVKEELSKMGHVVEGVVHGDQFKVFDS